MIKLRQMEALDPGNRLMNYLDLLFLPVFEIG